MTDRKPPWLKVRPGGDGDFAAVRRALRQGGLHTVCDEARCPNRGECWGAGTATFLILGDVCTRGCRFCSVSHRRTPDPPDPHEPQRLARCAADLRLRHVVLTSVSRDDLPDGGASAFVACIRALRALTPTPTVEVLTPDYLDEPLHDLLRARPDVFAHNLEVVRRLSAAVRHPRCDYDRSLATLAAARRFDPHLRTKSSLLLGLGESPDELRQSLRDLRHTGTDVLVLGQYLQPTPDNLPVARWVPPDEFDAWRREALDLGFSAVVAAPLARTSYHAAEQVAHPPAEHLTRNG